jgi:hypothetical protein
MPDRALTDDEIGRLKQACVSDDEDDQQVKKSTEQKKQERQSDEAVDARKIAFCESNPSDPHCEGESSGFSDQKDGDPADGKDIKDRFEENKKIFCAANPADETCAGDFGDSKDGDTGGDDADICKVKPDDAQCTGGGSGSDDESKSESTPPPAPPPTDPKTKSPEK